MGENVTTQRIVNSFIQAKKVICQEENAGNSPTAEDVGADSAIHGMEITRMRLINNAFPDSKIMTKETQEDKMTGEIAEETEIGKTLS